jgi:hypothetical protein
VRFACSSTTRATLRPTSLARQAKLASALIISYIPELAALHSDPADATSGETATQQPVTLLATIILLSIIALLAIRHIKHNRRRHGPLAISHNCQKGHTSSVTIAVWILCLALGGITGSLLNSCTLGRSTSSILLHITPAIPAVALSALLLHNWLQHHWQEVRTALAKHTMPWFWHVVVCVTHGLAECKDPWGLALIHMNATATVTLISSFFYGAPRRTKITAIIQWVATNITTHMSIT